MTEYDVTQYEDLRGATLSDAGKDRVLMALENGHEAVIYAEQWIIDEKNLDCLSGSYSLVAVNRVEAESEKAWLIVQDGEESWVPKSVCELYRQGEGDVDTETNPQQFLKEFGS